MLTSNPLGHADLNVTPIGLGLAALGRPGYINLGHGEDLKENYDVAAMESRTHEVLDAAWGAGVRYFDAARSYGRAEQFLRSWLDARQIEPSDVAVGSKWGYTYTADWQVNLPEGEKHEIKEHSVEVLERQVAESYKHLNGHFDLYQIHSATLESGVLDNEAVLARLGALRAAGLRIGFSVSGPNQAETILRGLEICIDEQRLFCSVQATWNLLERSTIHALEQAHEAGVGVIIKEALANGRLTARNKETSFRQQMSRLVEAAESRGTTVDALALAAVLAQPWVDVVLSGAATVAQVKSNISAIDIEWDDELADWLADLGESPAEYWSTRSDLAWN